MNQSGDQRLAGARSAVDQDRGRGRRDASDQVARARDPGGFAEQDAVMDGRCRRCLQLRAAQRQPALHRGQQALVVPGLDHEVGRAAAHRADGDRDPAMPGDDDDDRPRVRCDQPVEHRETLLARGPPAREVEVEQDDVDRFAGEQHPGRLRVRRGRDAHAVPFEQ
jgi:hypothetical protein